MSLTINNQNVNVIVKELKSGTSLQQAEVILKKAKDGYDTIGLTVDGKDYLAIGQGLKNPAGKQIMLDGKEAKVAFFENESNTALEGAAKAIKSTTGLVATGITAASGAVFGATVGYFGSAIMSGLGWGSISIAGPAIGCAIVAGGAALAITVGVGAIKGAVTKGNDVIVSQMTK